MIQILTFLLTASWGRSPYKLLSKSTARMCKKGHSMFALGPIFFNLLSFEIHVHFGRGRRKQSLEIVHQPKARLSLGKPSSMVPSPPPGQAPLLLPPERSYATHLHSSLVSAAAQINSLNATYVFNNIV